jgi:hypothetical protein
MLQATKRRREGSHEETRLIFHSGPTTEQFKQVVPETILCAIAKAIINACPPVVKRCRRLYPEKMLATVIGLDRYFEIQRAIYNLKVLRNAFPFFEIVENRHENAAMYFMAIETPEMRIAVNKVDSAKALPTEPQRLQTWPRQPTLFEKKNRHYASLLYGFGDDPAVVAFVHLRFLQADGQYLREEGIDLLALLKTAATTATVETVKSTVVTRLRGRKKIRRDAKPESAS